MPKKSIQSNTNPPVPAAPPAGQKTHLLIVEDEQHLADSVARRLEEEGYAVDIANDGEAGFRMASSGRYDLIILDLLLPRKDGLEVLRELKRSDVRSMILILTAKSTVEDRVQGLQLGADDYLPKPFAFAELSARIESLLRRHGLGPGPVLEVADLKLDLETRTVSRGSKTIQLTQKEFSLLEILLRNKNRILTRRTIAEQVWGYTFDTGTNVVDVYVNYLRKAIDEGFPKRLIHTVRGVGFILKEE
ncbi:MAG TPA: response regulator [Bacteroidota bacterium]|jgi:DNA-binding response OmpR family regulator